MRTKEEIALYNKMWVKQNIERQRKYHRDYYASHKSSEYEAWRSMKGRCLNPNHKWYSYYGGRGITVCDRWMKYANFLEDMGKKPSPELSLERINNDNGYEPSNCKWATKAEQTANRRPKRTKLEIQGILKHD